VAEPEGELVRVRACGLCGTDVEKIGLAPPGTVLGHEVVAETAAGERVALVHHLPCGECERCRGGHETTCARFREPTIEPGGFAERVRAAAAVPLPDAVDDVLGTLVEPLACVLRASERIPRGRVLVVGCGFVGQLWARVLRAKGNEVFARDPDPARLALAGAGEPDGPVDAAVLCAPAGVGEALEALQPGGTLLVFSWLLHPTPVDLGTVLRRELRILGAVSATPEFMTRAVDVLPRLDPIPIEVLPLDRFEEGLERYRGREVLKVVFTP
jgi:L-iditol 2-dehydrogenase